jgi:hypothetical protein
MHAVRSLAVAATLALVCASCKDPKQEAARRSATQVPTHVRDAREGLDRLTRGFQPVLEGLAPHLAAPMAAHNTENIRFALIGLGSEQTPSGSLAFFPTGFVVAVGMDGIAIARNVAEPDDLMHGMPLANMFSSVRDAIAGHGGQSVGELPATADSPSRVYLVAAVPVRDVSGTILGALAAGISYGQLARSLDTAVRVHSGQEPVLWVGLRRNGRVLPSGHDRDVPERWLIPQPLISAIPRDADARIEAGHGQFVWTFIEGDARGWGGSLAAQPQLQDTTIVIFRSEARQN